MRRLAYALGVLSCALCAWPSVGFAEQRVLVREIEGQNGKHARDAVVAELRDHSIDVVSSDGASDNLDSASGRVEAAQAQHLSAIVQGQLERSGNKSKLTITVYDGRQGEELDSATISAPKNTLPKQVHARLWDALGSALQRAKPPEEKAAEPEPVAADTDTSTASDTQAESGKDADEADDAEGPHKYSPLDVSIGARVGTRDFSYSDPLPGLRSYQLGVSPAVALHLHWYPAAHFSDGILAQLGIDLRGEMLVGVSSKNNAGQSFSTNSSNLGVGLRFRVPMEKNELGFVLGYGQHSFAVAAAKGIDPDVPDVSHSFIRAGAEARWAFADPLSLQLGAAYLAGLSQGEIASKAWFPHASGGGIEAELGLNFGVANSIELQAAVTLQRYFMSLNPLPTDASVVSGQHRVAGGALDQFLSLRLSALWHM